MNARCWWHRGRAKAIVSSFQIMSMNMHHVSEGMSSSDAPTQGHRDRQMSFSLAAV